MIIQRLTQAVSIAGVAALMLAGNAMAGSITYSTNAPGTGFVSSNGSPIATTLTLTSSSSNDSTTSTLLFTPNLSSTTGTPSGLDLGDFLLSCSGCSTTTIDNYSSFVMHIDVTDSTDGASGEFIGTSAGGQVSSNSDTISITWSTSTPGGLTLGPGTVNAITGNFGSTVFDKQTTVTVLAAPNSGSPVGDTTVQGQIVSSPEPATFALFGGGLLSIGFYRRRKLFLSWRRY